MYSYIADRKLGYTYSKEKDIYDGLDKLDINDILSFHKEKISQNNYTIVIIGSVKDLDMKSLGKFGEVEVLQIRDLFPY